MYLFIEIKFIQCQLLVFAKISYYEDPEKKIYHGNVNKLLSKKGIVF